MWRDASKSCGDNLYTLGLQKDWDVDLRLLLAWGVIIIILPSSTFRRWIETLLMSYTWRWNHSTLDARIVILIHPWLFTQHRICHPVLGLPWVAWRILHISCSWWTQIFPTLWVTLKRCWKQCVQVRLSEGWTGVAIITVSMSHKGCRFRGRWFTHLAGGDRVQFRFPGQVLCYKCSQSETKL